jgi:hypothetical protein
LRRKLFIKYSRTRFEGRLLTILDCYQRGIPNSCLNYWSPERRVLPLVNREVNKMALSAPNLIEFDRAQSIDLLERRD